ncbi:Dos2-interacting transcription regulator of RNA-Pol-II-domain-containing protein [Bombardia bombarda]|uniref:MMS19 nucleotide excision repair protein n=1 Tax=Bombardia bombarda TaxID=252184 RepID=A0AA39X790_9PEZI|nr:Dos2-interacting transcription regulator of RNA-Pol-II-domain-containing protein [Bombardia bombarda]
MATFKDWALQYVLADEEPVQRELAQKAAREIESSRASSTVVGNWAASIQQWLTTAHAKDSDQMDEGEDGGSGDIIARAKALGFLADTLQALDKNMLRADQVVRLAGFFGAMFSYDHKAGITASAKALRQLYSMKNFKPDVGVQMVDAVLMIKEDFRLQTPVTRLEIYELFLGLFQDQAVSSLLQHKYGSSQGFIVDLLRLCQNERDPRNLLVWFKILGVLLADYAPSADVTEEIFKTFSAYFPISLKSSATPIGITAEDLKSAVRACFAAHQRVAPLAFPYLMQKLDQGDAVTVAVKVDILRTIKACLDEYDHPQNSVVPFVEKIWNSLKYEVRNGEVKETIDATLDVLRAIANKLDGTKSQKLDVSLLKSYIDIVFKDCRDDLSNPTYTKQAGLLLMTVITANIRAYTLESGGFVECIRQNLRQPKSPSHTRDLLLLLNSALKSRLDLVRNRKEGHPEDEELLRTEPRAHLDALFHEVYLPIWVKKANEPDADTVDVLKKVTQGLALLVSQRVLQPDGALSLLCSGTTCSEICSLLTQSLIKGLALSSNDNITDDTVLEDEAVLALRTVVMSYTDGYIEIASRAKAEIQKRQWSNPSRYSLNALKDLLSRLAFIGCSEIPSRVSVEGKSQKTLSALQHLVTLIATLLNIFPLSSPSGSARFADHSARESSLANAHVISALHGGMLHFRDACASRYQKEVLVAYSGSDRSWIEEFSGLPFNWLQQLQGPDGLRDETIELLREDDPEVYRQYLRLGLFTVRYIYRKAASGSQTLWNERILAQVANITALVVRALDEKLQITCDLAHEAFRFFHAGDGSLEQKPTKPLTELLTLGILEGLRPGALADLYIPGGAAEAFLCNTADLGPFPSRASEIRAAIGAILVNKYKGGPSTCDPESQTIKKVLGFWANQIKVATSSVDIDINTFEAYNSIAMYIFAGAIARQDKSVVQEAVPVLHEAIASGHHNGELVARSMGILVKDNNLLSEENHAVVKRLYKQWAYSQLVRPLYKLALPTGKEADVWATNRYTAAILAVVSNCPFKVYEEDVEVLTRLLIATLGGNRITAGLSKQAARMQVASALEILVQILANEPESLKGHLKAVIGGAMNVHQEASLDTREVDESSFKYTIKPTGAGADLYAVSCRKLTLQLLGLIPSKFEERHLLPYALQLKRMLATASGDPVREVRKVALLARGGWAKVG